MAQQKPFAVVEFTAEEAVSIVPTLWLVGNPPTKCYFPPSFVSETKRLQLVKDMTIWKKSWKTHPVRVLTYSETYEKAEKYEDLAQNFSTFESEADDGGDGSQQCSTASHRLVAGTDVSVSNQSVAHQSNRLNSSFTTSTQSSQYSSTCSTQSFPISVPVTNFELFAAPETSAHTNYASVLEERNSLDNDLSASDEETVTHSQILDASPSNLELKKLLLTLIQKVDDLKRFTANQFVKVNEEISAIQQGPSNSNDKPDPDIDVQTKLPLNCVDDLSAFETWLTDEVNKEKTSRYFSQIGGSNAPSITRRILNRLFTKPFAQEVNFSGQNNKVKFSSSALYAIVKSAVLRHKVSEGATERSIEEAVQNWFRFAKARNKPKDDAGQ